MTRSVLNRRPTISPVTCAALAATLIGSTLTFVVPANAQSLSPYGMWSDRDENFRARRSYREERYYQPRRAPSRYDSRYRDDYDYYGYDDYYDDDPRARSGRVNPNAAPPADVVRNGGARPVIAAKAPPLIPLAGKGAPGSIVIDVGSRKLYYIVSDSSAYAYPIGVGREGFSWTGTETVSRIAEWPDWHPPAEMRQRQPELPTKMLGGLRNPLGAKAIYLGNTLYRIHGTNDPKSIGRSESSGCFRMMNAHVVHLASLVQVGAQVSVVSSLAVANAATGQAQPVAAEAGDGAVAASPAVARSAGRASWDDNDDANPEDADVTGDITGDSADANLNDDSFDPDDADDEAIVVR